MSVATTMAAIGILNSQGVHLTASSLLWGLLFALATLVFLMVLSSFADDKKSSNNEGETQ